MTYDTRLNSIAEQARYLETHAHCLAIKINEPNAEKYFILDTLTQDVVTNELVTKSNGFRVLYKKVGKDFVGVQIINYTPDDIQLMVNSMGLQFGD